VKQKKRWLRIILLIPNTCRIEKHFQVLGKIGCLGESPGSGYLRAAYSDEETEAMRYIEKCALAMGAESRWDRLGNLSLLWQGSSGLFVETASHLDTVPFGGNFDGTAGVVAGLVAIEELLKSNKPLHHGFRLRIWRAEESATFNSVYAGSRGAFGQLDPKVLTHRYGGRTLAEAMLSQNADPEVVSSGTPTIEQHEVDSIVAHIELHIEQGNLLEKQGLDVGIVDSIRGPRRFLVTLTGKFDHSGATPMGTDYRRDVNLALGYIMVELDKLCKKAVANGSDLVQTTGVINSSEELNKSMPQVYQNAVPKVSGFGYFCLDIRSKNLAFLDSYCEDVKEAISQTAQRFNVQADTSLLSSSPPLEALSESVISALQQSASDLKISATVIPSGAGHDAAVVGSQKRSDNTAIPTGMIFIPCRGGESHCPEEYTSPEAIAKGAAVLALAMQKLSEPKPTI